MSWTPLQSPDPALGPKAARLATVAAAGLRIPDSWTLSPDAPPDAPGLFARAPQVRRWMLRSSSTLEDRPGQSAAGLFHSESAVAVPEAISAAVARVRASAEEPAVAELLGATAPLTVLAQPHLDLQGWWTVELTDDTAHREGWGVYLGVEDLARAAADACGIAPALAEIGVDDRGPVVLQVRPSPAGRPRTATPTALDPLLHPLPDDRPWRWDREHAPTPLCPLLAGVFARWLASKGPDFPVTLWEGHWHEVDEDPDPASRADAEASQRRWEEERAPDLEARLRSLASRADTLDATPTAWSDFTGDWLAFQDAYFAEPTRAIRRWALAQPRRPGALASTIPARRERELDALAARRDDPDFEEHLAAFLEEHGHVAVHPWDGRGVTWAEDPRPVRAEIERRVPDGADPAPDPVPDDLASRILRRCEDDDEFLARAYALFRRAARRVERELGLARRPGEILEVVETDLLALLRAPDAAAWRQAVARGRSLAARWARWSGDSSEGKLRGVGASAGRARGPVVRAGSARDVALPAGAILVVPTILPSDAPVFRHAGGIICEAGDTLGHAAILAREHGIPLVVGVADARIRLREAKTAEIDGDYGEIRILTG